MIHSRLSFLTRVFLAAGVCFFVMSGLFSGYAQETIQKTDPEKRMMWYDRHVVMKENSIFKNQAWQFLGPTNISGRMTDIAVVTPKGKSYTIYVAGASGGVWKTVNEGITWEPIFENAPSTSIGDVTIAPSNQDTVWIGTGEANIFRSSMAGCGVYKSTDAGKTWKHMGLAGVQTIPRIVIHPKNPDIVYVAASGNEWTQNKARGVYRTTDGGKNWKKVLYINDMTGAIDLVMDTVDPRTVYAATWQRIRKKWNDPRNEDHYTGSGIYKTTDAGETWEEVVDGLPEAKYRGRIGLDLCAAKPNVLYAFIDNYALAGEADEGETDSYGRPRGGTIKGATVYRTDDKGRTWKQVSEESRYMERLSATYGWVFGQIRVDPVDENKVYIMGLGLNVSEDGGKTFRRLGGMHGDHHGLWIDPENTDYLVNVNDGGLSISYDAGENWRNYLDNLPLVQFYNVGYDMDVPFHIYGSIQDHGSRQGIVDLSRGRNRIPAQEWTGASGGEASTHAVDPTNPNILYSAGFYGSISRTDQGTGSRTSIMPRVEEGEPKLRGQWLAPFIISPHNPRIIYHGMNFLFRSMNQGDTWDRISPDLTYNDPNKMGDIPYQTIFSIAESPLKFGLLYVGTDDGRVHMTFDSGKNWTEIMNGLPHGKWVSRIVASAYDEGLVYMTQNGKRDDDFAAYIWKSTDYGQTWEDISGNIPCGPVNVIREDPKNRDILYVGTDLGVYISLSGGKLWHVLANGLSTTFVHDLIIHPRDQILVAATHGRGMYAMDVQELQQLNKEILAKAAHLFDIKPARIQQGFARGSMRGFRGRAPETGARIKYYLKSDQKVVITILNEADEKVRTIEQDGKAGLNTAVWNLTAEPREGADEQQGEGEARRGRGDRGGRTGRGGRGTTVSPGTYKVVLKAGTTELEGEVKVE